MLLFPLIFLRPILYYRLLRKNLNEFYIIIYPLRSFIHFHVTKDARGRTTLVDSNEAVKPEPLPQPVELSLDIQIQRIVERTLATAVQKSKAVSGSAVVMDAKTREILAIASVPTFDPNAPGQAHPMDRKFRAVMDALELGSVLKPFVMACALDRGVVKKDEKLFCEQGHLSVLGQNINDTHAHGWLNLGEILKFSSNICLYKLAQRLGRQGLYDCYQKAGLTRSPGTGFSGEWQGQLNSVDRWHEMRFANLAFGQGVAISPLHMAKAMAILADHGVDKGLYLEKIPNKNKNKKKNDPITSWPIETFGPHLQFVKPWVADHMAELMAGVVEPGGTGRLAAVENIDVAGKTGTAQKFSPITRTYSQRVASFAGFAPAHDPRLVVVVVLDEPAVRPAYGGVLAGPVFSEIVDQCLHYLNASGQLAVK